MNKFPADAPKKRVIKTLELLGFEIIREREHIATVRNNSDGTKTPLTLPNHARIKGSTLRTICNQEFLVKISYESLKRVKCEICNIFK